MNELQFTIDIDAPQQKVWDTLWNEATFRDWSGLIDPGTHMVGELKEGNEVQFISAEGYGVTSMVAKLIPGEYVLLKHQADTKDNGQHERDKQWTGGTESYSLGEAAGKTTLTTTFDVPPELEQIFNDSYPKALARIKELAEQQ